MLGYALSGSVLLFIVWAAIVDVDEITRGDAKVIPSRQLQVLQSLDGGIVSKIEVKEGDTVAVGQVLLQVDSTRFESSVRENRSQYLSLLAKAARLRAIGEEKPFVPPPEALAEDPRTVEEERRLYETATSELNAQLQIARQQLAQRSQELNEAQAKQRQAAQAFESTSRELAVTKPLLSSGAVSEVELLRLERDVSRFRGERRHHRSPRSHGCRPPSPNRSARSRKSNSVSATLPARSIRRPWPSSIRWPKAGPAWPTA
ncbi:biotin/lipoyl-binding protein [Massilia sp. B-10]|nr:biotin/lipoyl-binding protein [Massilia sp. B-10]